MSILKSKWFWAASTVSTSVAAIYFYDRQKYKEVQAEFLSKCRIYGDQPMSISEMPRKLTILCVEPNYPQIVDTQRRFRTFALPLINAAGIDHEFIEISRKQAIKEFKENVERKRKTIDVPFDGETEEKQKGEKILNEFPFLNFIGFNWSKEMNHSPFEMEEMAPEIESVIKPLYKKPIPSSSLFKDGIVLFNKEAVHQFLEGVDRAQAPIKPAVHLIDLKMPSGFISRIVQFYSYRNLMKSIGDMTMKIIEQEEHH